MSRAKKKTVVPFQLVGISTEEFATIESNYQEDLRSFDIDFNVAFKLNEEDRGIGVFTKYSFEQETKAVLILECACHFILSEDYWNEQIHDQGIMIPQEVLTHLLVLTVGTSRGIVHAKKPDWLTNLVLPTINVSAVVTEDMIFELAPDDSINEQKTSEVDA